MASQRISYLDGLRGVAASLVLVSHMAEQIFAATKAPWLDRTLDYVGFGRIGVVAFFCVSGFVIPFSLRAPHALRHFALSRFFRLYPAYWLSLALFLAIAGAFGMVFPAKQVLANITMAQAVAGQPDVIGVYWTLFYELVFYALCAGTFAVGWLGSGVTVMLGMGLLAIGASLVAVLHFIDFPIKPPLGLLGYLSIMVFGTVCRFAWLEDDPVVRRRLPLALAGILIMVTLVGLLGYAHGGRPDRPISDFVGVYLGIGLFLAAFRFKAALSGPVMTWMGRISYSLYLLHSIVALVCAKAAAEVGSDITKVAILLTVLPLSFLLAHLSATFVERPMIELGHRLARARA